MSQQCSICGFRGSRDPLQHYDSIRLSINFIIYKNGPYTEYPFCSSQCVRWYLMTQRVSNPRYIIPPWPWEKDEQISEINSFIKHFKTTRKS